MSKLKFFKIIERFKFSESFWNNLPTWIIAIVAIASSYLTYDNMKDQIQEMEKSRESTSQYMEKQLKEMEESRASNSKHMKSQVQEMKRATDSTTNYLQKQFHEMKRATNSTVSYMEKQVAEMKRATDLAWRPYCNIVLTDTLTFEITYSTIDPISSQIVYISIQEWPINLNYLDSTMIALIEISFETKFENFGKLPLWLNSFYFSTSKSLEWTNEAKKSSLTLIKTFREQDVFKLNETDNVVMPDSIFTSRVTKSIGRTITLKDLLYLAGTDSSLFLYPYTYIEYQDFKGKTFDAIRIYFLEVKIDTLDDRFSYQIVDFGTERYAWDVFHKGN